MNRRWFTRLGVVVLFFLMIIMLYSMLESINIDRNERQKSNNERINEHLDTLQDSIEDLNKAINLKRRKRSVRNISNEHYVNNQSSKVQCTWQKSSPMKTTFEVRQLYESLRFDHPEDGLWPQDGNIFYNISQWTSTNKLKIILMPHSHCDPGWLNTFEVYFQHTTKFILNTMLNMLERNQAYRFIWAEISFLSLWWDQATPEQRNSLKKLILNQQLEIVTGGWVMNDEANTHYFSMIDQLIEGHQFIDNKLGNISIKSSWANDPFGYSPTMAYLLQNAGIEHLAIQRVHYHIKNALAKEKQFEFLWQQPWDRNQSTRIFTHVLPFTGYDIPHTCGPNPKVCCQFDFRRGIDSYPSCFWGIDPTAINEENVHERAQLLLDQYRQKSQLYRTNILFVQLGDDFRFRTIREAKLQFDNYDKLMIYMNAKQDWNVDIRYGTLTDYFDEVLRSKSRETFPSYTGDFFTYADRDHDYWSGYYTSRAFFKRMNRIAESYLRATEIAFSFAHIETNISNFFPKNDFFSMLITARRHLSVFQHHDGITGTSRDHVVNNYGTKLFDVIKICQIVMQQSIAYLLFQNDFSLYKQMLILNEEFTSYQTLSNLKLLSFKNQTTTYRTIFIYNPTDQQRIEIIRVLIDTPYVRITSHQKPIIDCQIDPKWIDQKSNILDENQFELLIRIDIQSYAIKEYTIHFTNTIEQQSCPMTTIEYINKQYFPKNTSIFNISLLLTNDLIISNRVFSILFSKTGAIHNLYHKIFDENLRFHTNIISYSSLKQSTHHSGAYLFIPNGHAEDIPLDNYRFFRIQRNKLIHQIDLVYDMFALRYQLTNTNSEIDQTIQFSVTTHLQSKKDLELAVRFSTGIKNNQEFFTDLNGFQMIRRKIYEKMPLQGNVYPMPTMSYIEDDNYRFSVLASQSSGITCLKSGLIDVFLDRRLHQDDGRGLGQGVLDNREIIRTFQLLFEQRQTSVDRTSLTGYPTLLAHRLSLELIYPLHIFHYFDSNHPIIFEYSLFSQTSVFPIDYHLINFRTLIDLNDTIEYHLSKNIAFIVRRLAFDCQDDSYHFQQPKFDELFSRKQIESIEQTSLSLRSVKQILNNSSNLDIPIGEIRTYKIRFY